MYYFELPIGVHTRIKMWEIRHLSRRDPISSTTRVFFSRERQLFLLFYSSPTDGKIDTNDYSNPCRLLISKKWNRNNEILRVHLMAKIELVLPPANAENRSQKNAVLFADSPRAMYSYLGIFTYYNWEKIKPNHFLYTRNTLTSPFLLSFNDPKSEPRTVKIHVQKWPKKKEKNTRDIFEVLRSSGSA